MILIILLEECPVQMTCERDYKYQYKAKIPFVRVRSGYGNLPPATIRQFMTTFLGQDSICTLTVRFSNPIFTRF